jgi:anti-sigma factor RsiW
MGASPSIDEADLHALVDNEISGEERLRVEDHLAGCPEDAALVEGWRRQNAALRAAFEPVAQERPPLSLRNAAQRNAAAGAPPIESGAIHWGRPSSSTRSLQRLEGQQPGRRAGALASTIGALLAGAVIAGAAVFVVTRPGFAPSSPTEPSYVERADRAYHTYAFDPRPVEFDAAQKDELLNALRSRLGFARAPDLSSLDLKLLGARVTPGLRGPAGVLIYERGDLSARVALYYEKADSIGFPRDAPRVDQTLTAIEWRAAGYDFVLIGPLGAEAMQQAAERAAAEMLTPGPAR